MNMRLLFAFCAFAPLVGCVSLPGTGTNLLLTPIGVAGIHSFAVPRAPDSIDLEKSVAAATADARR